MDNRLYILGTTVGSLSIGVGLGKRSRFVTTTQPLDVVATDEIDEAPVDKRHSDETEGTPSMGEIRENPAGSRVSESTKADYYDYTKPYSQSRDDFETSLVDSGDPEDDEGETEPEDPKVYEVFDDAETWSKHPDGYQPITLTLYAYEDLCMDANGMFVDQSKLKELIGEAYEKALESKEGEDVIFYVRNHIDKLDVQLIVSSESYYETRYGKERKGKKGGKFRDTEY